MNYLIDLAPLPDLAASDPVILSLSVPDSDISETLTVDYSRAGAAVVSFANRHGISAAHVVHHMMDMRKTA